MKLKLLTFYLILYYSQQLQLPLAETASVTSIYGLHGQCKGLRPVHDDHGDLIGYKGSCDVDKWNGSLPSVNSLHPVDPNLMALNNNNENFVTHSIGKIKYKQPKDVSLFDWLSPHHDIIRNHPHYRYAHMNHNHCIRKAKTGLFDFIESLFNYDSHRKNHNQPNDFKDPYSDLDEGARCLNSQYYNNNSLDIEKKYYDTYALHLAHKIHNIQGQFDSTDNANPESMKKDLRKNYGQLYRHLDCHCHHELPQSQMLNIHHHPIEGRAMNIIAHPIAGPAADNLQMHSSIPLDANMDMENDHMTLTRMANVAAQHAYKMNHFNDDSLSDNGSALQMEMFHPTNYYINNDTNYKNNNTEWNRLRVEKVIVIKRIKVPVVTKVSVPVPVPVPYPIPTSSNSTASDDNQYLNYNGSDSVSQLNDSQPQFLGKNTYIIDSSESQPEQMNGIVRAISGAPCESAAQAYINPHYYPTTNQFENQRYNYSSPVNHCNMMNTSNFLPPQMQYNPHLIPPMTTAATASQNQLQGSILTNSNYKY
jgi:hypothetical protein